MFFLWVRRENFPAHNWVPFFKNWQEYEKKTGTTNTPRNATTYFSRAARIFTISSGSIPLLSFDSWALSGSFVSSMLSSFCVGRGVNFWAHCLRRSFPSRTTLQQSSHFMTNDAITISCSHFAIKGYNPQEKTTKSNMWNFLLISPKWIKVTSSLHQFSGLKQSVIFNVIYNSLKGP